MKNALIGLLLITTCSMYSTYHRYSAADINNSIHEVSVQSGTNCKIWCYYNEKNGQEWRLILNGKPLYTILNSKSLHRFLKNDMNASVWTDSHMDRFATRITAEDVAVVAILQKLHEPAPVEKL